ncbi:hypothetical protein [Ruixingdingia sedimenti]|uniref:Uncharacterized protein n=1 Tax=Ruixingdingia sedimenti TaxID=3073604 RepID=A0ABU1FCN7_9RHOB|nr:hypothetical protein [Xinfangfangia sp. LG-4]MDR5654661.1 hypothetical protein [Xinfangfangia sp. LG-4]
MIIAPKFEGDDHLAAMDMQHQCYHDALSVLVSHCNRLTRFARDMLEDSLHPTWGYVERFDHRTMQEAHDLLAAVWRCRTCGAQGRLPYENVDPWPEPKVADWLSWLDNEVTSWIKAPRLVRAVQMILANQNQEQGYQAEEELAAALVARFPDVPWTRPLSTR